MIRRLCRNCSTEMNKELTPDGPKFFCENCDGHTLYDELDMESFCPKCGDKLQFCGKCGNSYFCNGCMGIVSSKKIIWKEK